jgi:3-dehydroquinate synthase
MPKLTFRSKMHFHEYTILFGTVCSYPDCIEAEKYFKAIVLADQNTLQYANALPYDKEFIEVGIGEESKSLLTAIEVYKRLEKAGATRRSTLIIGVGGGAICDLAGFVAMTYMRGIPYALYPTTLVAMADAAVGSKVAVNAPSGSKNLIGGYWSPKYVQIDLSTLGTLSERAYQSGFGEIIKMACIAEDNGALLNYLEGHVQELSSRSYQELKYVLERAIAKKIKFVRADFFEKDLNRLLNLGHALGHAVEASSDYQLLHGESVAIGLAEACRVGINRGFCKSNYAERVIKLLDLFKLPNRLPDWLPDNRLRRELETIICVRDGSLREVIPVSPGKALIQSDIEISDLINRNKLMK